MRQIFILFLLGLAQTGQANLKFLTLNTWHGGAEVKDGIKKISRQVKRSGAQVIFLQEVFDAAPAIAKKTNLSIVSFGDSAALLTDLPVVQQFRFNNSVGAVIKVNGKFIGIVSMHLTAYPYGPYLACFDGKSNSEVQDLENQVRALEAAQNLKQIFESFPKVSTIILGGDFNTPSHLDWTEKTKSSHCNRTVEFPVTKILEQYSFRDSYREIHPNPASDPGNTWSPREKTNQDNGRPEPQDRIDMIHLQGNLKVIRAEVFLDKLQEWPSDHAGVLVELALGN